MLLTSDTEMDFADVVLTAGSSSNILLWTLWTFQTMPCLSTLVVNPVELWDDTLVQRLLVPNMTDWALGDDCCAASKLDGDGRHTEERWEQDDASTSTRGPESYMDTIVSEHAIITGTWTYLEICPSGVGPEPGEYIFHCPLLRLRWVKQIRSSNIFLDGWIVVSGSQYKSSL